MIRLVLVMALIWMVRSASAAAQQPAASGQPTPAAVRFLAFSPDGKTLAVVYRDKDSLAALDLPTGKQRFAIAEPARIRSIAYSPRGDVLAVAVGKSAMLLDPQSGQILHELKGNRQAVLGMIFQSDGKQLATAGDDRTVKTWDTATGEALRTFAVAQQIVVAAAISPDGKWLAAASQRDSVELLSLEAPTQPTHKYDTGGAFVPQLVFSPDSRLLAIPDWSGCVSISDTASGNSALRFIRANSVNCLAFSPDGNWMALATVDRPLAIDLISLQQSPSEEQRHQIDALVKQFQNDDFAKRESATRQLASLGAIALAQLRTNLDSPSAEVRVRCRRLVERIQDVRFAKKLIGHEAEPNCVAFSPDGILLASGDSKGIVKLWTIPDGTESATLLPNRQLSTPSQK